MLVHHPSLEIQRSQIAINHGLREQQSGVFDTLLDSDITHTYTQLPLTPYQQSADGNVTTETANQTNSVASVSRLFRTGVTLDEQFNVERTTDNIAAPGGSNASNEILQVVIPLLRGRGREAVAAFETAAAMEEDAGRLDLVQLAAQLTSSVVSDYWNLRAAQQLMQIAGEAEDRGRIYVQNTQAMIDANQLPRNDANEIRANLKQRTAARLLAELQLESQQHQLAADIGESATQQIFSRLEASDAFPVIESEPVLAGSTISLAPYLDLALTRRADYLAAALRYAEANRLYASARNRLLPKINLQFGVGYYAVHDGRSLQKYFQGIYSQIPGPNISGGVSYSFSPRNEEARGAALQALQIAHQMDLNSIQISRSISQGILDAGSALEQSAARDAQDRESVQLFHAALDGAREKYRAGIGSVVEILTIEDRLTAAQQDEVQAQLAYQVAAIHFRFATGTLFDPRAAVFSVSERTLTRSPVSVQDFPQP